MAEQEITVRLQRAPTVVPANGRDGAPGRDGARGAAGPMGLRGVDGMPGKDGAAGRDGVDGKDGKPGKNGVTQVVYAGGGGGGTSTTSAFTAADYVSAGWTVDPAYAAAANVITAGNLYYGMIKIATTGPVSNASIIVTTGATTPTYGAIALYDATGNQLAVSANQSANWVSTGTKVVPFVTPTASLAAGTLIWVALETVGGTGMAVRGLAVGGGLNLNLTAATGLRSGVNVAGATNPIPTTLVQSIATTASMLPLVLLT